VRADLGSADRLPRRRGSAAGLAFTAPPRGQDPVVLRGLPDPPGARGGSQARWTLRTRMSWLDRAGTAVILTVCLALWALGGVGVVLVIWATLGAATGLGSGPPSFVMTTYPATGYLVVAAAVVWLALWTGGGSFTAGMLHTVLWGREVVELVPGELRIRRR